MCPISFDWCSRFFLSLFISSTQHRNTEIRAWGRCIESSRRRLAPVCPNLIFTTAEMTPKYFYFTSGEKYKICDNKSIKKLFSHSVVVVDEEMKKFSSWENAFSIFASLFWVFKLCSKFFLRTRPDASNKATLFLDHPRNWIVQSNRRLLAENSCCTFNEIVLIKSTLLTALGKNLIMKFVFLSLDPARREWSN